MAISFIQTKNANAAGAGVATIAAITTTSANFLVVAVAKDDAASTITITDSNTNVWAQAIRQTGTAQTVDIWYAKNIKGGAAHTVTATSSTLTDDMAIVVQEFSGMHLVNPLDKTTSATSAGGTNPTSGATATTLGISQELVFGALCSADATIGNITVGAGFSNFDKAIDATFAAVAGESLIAGSVAAQTANFVDASSVAYCCAVATFRGARSLGFNQNSLRPHPFNPGLAR